MYHSGSLSQTVHCKELRENSPCWKVTLKFKPPRCLVKTLTIIVALTKKLQEAEDVTCKFIIRHHFLIWAEEHRKSKWIRAKERFSCPKMSSHILCVHVNSFWCYFVKSTVANKTKHKGLAVFKVNTSVFNFFTYSYPTAI